MPSSGGGSGSAGGDRRRTGGAGCCCCYNRARRRASQRSLNSTAAAATAAEAEAVAAAASSAMQSETQWSEVGGPYLQQVMPGLRLGLAWYQLLICLVLITLLSGMTTIIAFANWTAAKEVAVDYSSCVTGSGNGSGVNGTCDLMVDIPDGLTLGPVYVYYALTNAYFNHRKVQTSWSMPQLLGESQSESKLKKVCGKNDTKRDGAIVLPCGALPNAIFNDTLEIVGPLASDTKGKADKPDNASRIVIERYDIGWSSQIKGLCQPLTAKQMAGTTKPASWPENVTDRYRHPFTDSEDLWIWLSTPAFPNFRKLYGRVSGGLPAGKYRLRIGSHYPVREFGGTKRFILGIKTALGARNPILGLLPAAVCAGYTLLCFTVLIECQCRGRCRGQLRRAAATTAAEA